MKNKAIRDKDTSTPEGFLTWLADMLVSSNIIVAESQVYRNINNCAEELVDRAERIKMLCGPPLGQHKVAEREASDSTTKGGKLFFSPSLGDKQEEKTTPP